MPSTLLHETANGLQIELPGFTYWVKAGMGVAVGVMLTGALASVVGLVVVPGIFMVLMRSAHY